VGVTVLIIGIDRVLDSRPQSDDAARRRKRTGTPQRILMLSCGDPSNGSLSECHLGHINGVSVTASDFAIDGQYPQLFGLSAA
jgi:hypothetical protein